MAGSMRLILGISILTTSGTITSGNVLAEIVTGVLTAPSVVDWSWNVYLVSASSSSTIED